MGGVICCAGSTCCSCLCGICMRCCGTSHQQHTRLAYLTLTMVAILFGLIFLYFGEDMMAPWEKFGYGIHHLDCSGDKESVCLGVFTIYRESFTLVIFYTLMLLGSLPGSQFSTIFNQSCWTLKVLFIIAFFILTFFIPNSFFAVFREICRYVSVLYLLVQIIVIIDFGYSWSESWTDNYEQSGNSNQNLCLLFFFSGLFWAISLTTTVLSYYWFANDTGCGTEIALITLTLAFGIGFTILSITPFVENGSLLTSSVVNCYIAYLCWDGLTNNTNTHCNTWNSAQDTGISITISVFVLLITLSYICFRKREKIQDQTPLRNAAEPILADDEDGDEQVPYKEDADESLGKKLIWFHGFMLLSSFYLSMLLTNWGSANIKNDDSKTYENDEGSMWVKFSALWTTVLLYVWTLIAPRVCSGREF